MSLRSSKKGAAIVFFAVYALTLIGFVGLAVQASYLYMSKSLLQSALDLAAIKGASMMLAGHSDNAAESAAEAIAAVTVALNGDQVITGGPASSSTVSFIDADIPPSAASSRLRIDGRLRRNVFFINALPGIPNVNYVSATASATNAPVSLVIVLDHSTSMQSNTITMPPPWPPSNSRFYWATLVLRDYITPLLQVGDQISLITFSSGTAAKPTLNRYPPLGTTYSLSPVVTRYTRNSTVSDMQAALDAIPAPPPDNWTNTTSGLQAALQALGTVAPGSSRRKLVVLLTDGAATLEDYSTLDPLSSCELTQIEPSTDDLQRRVKTHISRSINASDSLRSAGALVHTIAFTTGLAVDQDWNSPYQNTSMSSPSDWGWAQNIKPLALMRIANVNNWMFSPPFPPITVPSGLPFPYPYDFPCTAPGASIAGQPNGQYVFTFDPTQLATALTNMINTVRVKLDQ